MNFSTNLATGELTQGDAKRYFSTFGWFAFAFYLILSAVSTAVVSAVALISPELLNSYLFSEIFSLITLYAISFPIAHVILARLPKVQPLKAELSCGDVLKAICICEAFILVGSKISDLLITAFSRASNTLPENPVAVSTTVQPIWMTLLFSVLLAPILEEIFFRKLVCDRMLPLGELYAVIIPSAFFAVCHGNFFQVFYTFLLGCFFSFIYVKTGKLRYTVILHVVVNFLGTVPPKILNELLARHAPQGDEAITAAASLSALAAILYSLLTLAVAVVGAVILVKNFRKIRFDSGILPPPRGKAASCALMNAGIAAAIAMYAFVLLGSLVV